MSPSQQPIDHPPLPFRHTVTGQALIFSLFMIAGLWVTPAITWHGPPTLHIVLEFIAGLLALVIAAGSLIRYLALGQRLTLLFGLSFLGAGMADLFHAWVSLRALISGEGVDPTTWTVGRLTLSLLLIASLLIDRYAPRARHIPGELLTAVVGTIVVTWLMLLLFAYYQPAFFSVNLWSFVWLSEWVLVPGFLVSAWGYWRLFVAQRALYLDWGAGAALLFGVSMIYAGRSFTFHDIHFVVSHGLKDLGYIMALSGLYMESLTLFRNLEHQREALRQSQQKYAALVNSIDGIVWELDAQTFRCSFVSQQAERILGYPTEQWLAESNFLVDHIYPEDREWVVNACAEAIKAQRDHELQYRMVAADGRVVWMYDLTTVVVENDQVVKLRGILVDITERKQAEEALRKSEEEHRLFFELDLAGYYLATPDGTILKCNQAFARLFGFETVEEAMALSPFSLDSNREERAVFLDWLTNQKGLEHYEETLHRKDGSVIHVIENAIGTYDEHGELKEIHGYLIDDTERRKVEQQFRQSQKMEAVGRLAGGIAHDFNNMLTVILGYNEIMLSQIPRSDSMYDEAVEIKLAAERAAALTRQILVFTRQQILQPKVLNLNDIVVNLDKMLRRLIGEDIELVMLTDPAIGTVKADPGQLEQVIMNLAVNARDAMPQVGKLTIETTNVELGDYTRSHLGVQPGPYVMLAVSDTGCGMDAETQSHIFEPFFTTKEVGKGTGLGLSTVYGIVKQSEGHIEVYSEPGGGTTFTIYLPCVAEAPDASVLPGRLETLPRGTETVLLVEDDLFARRLAAKVLLEAGYEVLEASNGEEALRIAAENGRSIHLLVTDVVMPQMGGKELAERMKTVWPEIKVLFMSGYTERTIVDPDSLDAGTAFLQKPFTESAMAYKVRAVLDG